VNQGDLSVQEPAFRPDEDRRAGRAGVRAPTVARKWRNGHGAKGAQEGGDVTEQTKQQPDAVPGKGAMPAGEIRARWAWVEAEVWTERMLTALEEGVGGGK
jgi:RNA-directed DNA polymerase